tara:strand:- start:17354 stop:17551 length:198 start_codon:yes stop_codon:yes gene_type:complete
MNIYELIMDEIRQKLSEIEIKWFNYVNELFDSSEKSKMYDEKILEVYGEKFLNKVKDFAYKELSK